MDRDLLGFALPDGATFPLDQAAISREEAAMQALANGTDEHKKIVQTIEEIVSTEGPEWSKRIALVLILDLITIACIMWLLTR